MADLEAFKGRLPYASELSGVYQPLLGWRSRQTNRRAEEESKGLIGEMLTGMAVDPRFEAAADEAILVDPFAPGDPMPPGLPYATSSEVASYVIERGRQIIEEQGRPPTGAEWRRIVSPRNMRNLLDSINERTTVADKAKPFAREHENFITIPKDALSEDEFKQLDAQPVEGMNFMVVSRESLPPKRMLKHESVMATLLGLLARNNPQLMATLLLPLEPKWQTLLPFYDPLANFDPETQQAVLSPLGLVHLYRQYFFELETFLGSPVGHVWISPGGTVELIEVSTRRTQTERLVETIRETTTRSELASLEQDELSDAVKEENERNINFGVSASGGFDVGVVHGEASANFGVETTNRVSNETAHKQMRQQSEKITSEIRQNFHTTFRTSTDVTDTSSRRHVVQNTTERLVNYELCRKMRRVAVQVQHIGTRMCWQVFVDDPGRELGIAELVHVAQPEDVVSSLQPPESPVLLAPKKEPITVTVPFHSIGDHDTRDVLYKDGFEDGDRSEDQIKHIFEFDAPPPGTGYKLSSITEISIEPVDPGEDLPMVSAKYEKAGDMRFRITMEQVNFNDQPAIRFVLNLVWDPPNQSALLQEYQRKVAEYTNTKNRDQHINYVKAVRERINMAGDIPKRTSSELRQEERTVVYRRLIHQLMKVNGDAPHVTSELIRSIFDVDAMLYFVAPEWWRPRPRVRPQIASAHLGGAGSGLTLTQEDKIGWGGVGAKGRDNYMITEESNPMPLGSSLGWLLQLDGDNHRNVFLNSPWVKAVIPIRQGHEAAALNWLQLAHVEGTEGLDAEYQGTEPEYRNNNGTPKTLRQVLQILARNLATAAADFDNVLATDTVFEKGFDPLEEGFVAAAEPFGVFDQWIEVLPTDQVVAVEYDAKEHI